MKRLINKNNYNRIGPGIQNLFLFIALQQNLQI